MLQITVAQMSPNYWQLLQIVLIFIKNYGSFHDYYKLRQKLLQIVVGSTIWLVLINCSVVTEIIKLLFSLKTAKWSASGKYYDAKKKFQKWFHHRYAM